MLHLSLRRFATLFVVAAVALVPVWGQATIFSSYSALSVELGQTATLSMSVYGTNPLTYQWVLVGSTTTNLTNGTTANGSTIAGATTTSLTITGTTAADAGNYALKVTDGNGVTVTSQAIALTVKPAAPPTITTQPSNTTVTAGNPATFSVTASGSYPRTFQWYKGAVGNGTAVTGATSNPFTMTYPLSADAGSYYVIVKNAQGQATSSAATLTVNPATPITVASSPSPVTVTVGQSFYLSFYLNGSGPITYQWSKSGTAISGATNYSYSVAAAATTDAGTYTLAATNAAGTVTTGGVTVTVNAPIAPTFTQQPQSTSIAYGNYFSLYVSVSGTPSPTVQWYKDGTAIQYATSTYYSVSAATTADAGSYTVKATNSGGTVTSSAATVTVAAPIAPTITTQPSGGNIPQGNSLNLSVVATGSNPLTYAWKKNGTAISGATNQNYYVSSAQSADAGSYTVTLTNAGGSVTSQAAVITIGPPAPPSFYSWASASSQTIATGASLSLSTPSLAGGIGPFTYQWYKDGAALSGATSSSYSVASAQISDSGSYVVTVTNAGGTASAPPVTVSVLPPAGSGVAWLDAKQQGTVVYFLFSDHLERYDLSSATFLAGTTFTQTATAFCVASDGVYIAFGRTLVKYSLTLGSQTTLANIAGSISGVFSHGTYVYAITNASYSNTYPVDRQTGAVGAAFSDIYSSATATPSVVVGDKLFVETIWGHSCFSFTSTGALKTETLTNYYTTFPSASHLYVFPDQTRVADTTGTVFAVSDDTVAGSFAGSFTDMTFLGDGTPVVLRGNVLYKYGGNGGYGETGHLTLNARPTSIFASGTTINHFTPAASSANSYITVASVSASTLVASASLATVDPTGRSYTPNAIAQDENGVVYLLSQTYANIFRWSPSSRAYLTSIPLTGTPALMAYSKTRHRLYCVYSSGSVTQIDTTAATPTEQPFGAFPGPVSYVLAADDFLAGGGSYSSGAVLNSSGRVTSFGIFGNYFAGSAWCSANQKFYGVGTGSINSMALSSGGVPGASVSFGYYTSNLAGPVFPAPDGSKVLAASGNVYPGDLSSNLGTLANTVVDAMWNGAMPITIRSGVAGTEVQSWWPTNLKLFASAQITGSPARVFPLSSGGVLLVTQYSGAPAFTLLNSDLQISSSTVAGTTSGAPAFTLQPAGSVSAFTGSSLSLAVDTTGATPQTFQWYKNGTAIASATASTLRFAAVSADDAANYYVTASNTQGSATSGTITLGVYAALQITTQPQSQAVPYGTSATLKVAVANGASGTYQWYKNGGPISGANSDTLVTDKVYYTATNGDLYNVSVTNAAGTVFSTTAVVTVAQLSLPVISGTSFTTAVAVGQTASFSVTATGTGTLTYQWYFNGAPISGATSSTYSITSAAAKDAGPYTVSVTNASGTVTSNPMVLMIGALPTIVQQPSSYSVASGSIVNLSVVAVSPLALNYQWYFNNQQIPGATDAVYKITGMSTANVGSYFVAVSNNAGGVNSNVVTLSITTSGSGTTVTPPPVTPPTGTPPTAGAPTITSQPASVTVNAGASATFSVSASTSSGSLAFQWYFNGSPIAGATSGIYAIPVVTAGNAGSYYVAVSNGAGSVNSNAASLSITGTVPPPTITSQPVSQTVDAGAAATFSVAASTQSGSLTFQWYFNGSPIAGATNATYAIPVVADAHGGGYAVDVSSAGGKTRSNTATLAVRARSYAGAYFGTFATGGRWAMYIRSNNTGYLVAYLPQNLGTTVASVTIASDGSFATSSIAGANTVRTSSVGEPPRAAAATTVTGKIASGAVTGQLGGTELTLSGAQDTGTTSAVSGFYSATALNGAAGATYTVVGGSGQAFVLSVSGSSADYASGVVDANGRLSATTIAGSTVSVALDPATQVVSATITPAGTTTPVAYGGISADATNTTRLRNVSVRGVAAPGAGVLIGGFSVTGGTKQMLVRGIGPTLATFGVSGALPNPLLTAFGPNAKVIWSGEAWGGSSTLSAAFTRLGAFALSPASGDSAAVLNASENTTIQVAPASGAGGIALAEIYDADETASGARLVNLSGRSNTGSGSAVLSAGFVIGGNGTAKILLRGIGPALTAFGVPGAVPAVEMTLFDGKSVAVATNAAWGGDAALAAAFVEVGAFGLSPNSADAALLVTLLPGNYTVQVAGKNGATGVALVEIYEMK